MVGDGSYLMMNSELATSVMLGKKLIVVVLDNRCYGCINRLQQAVGGAPFNNQFEDCVQEGPGMPKIDFAMHARSLGAAAENVKTIPELEAALARTTEEGGCWWEVAVPEVSQREQVRQARAVYEKDKSAQRKKL